MTTETDMKLEELREAIHFRILSARPKPPDNFRLVFACAGVEGSVFETPEKALPELIRRATAILTRRQPTVPWQSDLYQRVLTAIVVREAERVFHGSVRERPSP